MEGMKGTLTLSVIGIRHKNGDNVEAISQKMSCMGEVGSLMPLNPDIYNSKELTNSDSVRTANLLTLVLEAHNNTDVDAWAVE